MGITKSFRSAVLWIAVMHSALALALAGAVLAINQAIDGAATTSEQAVVLWGSVTAVIASITALAAWIRTRRLTEDALEPPQTFQVARRRSAVGLVTAASCFGVVVAGDRAIALIDHIRLRTDDPLTDVSLGLQVLVAVFFTGATIAFGLRGLRKP